MKTKEVGHLPHDDRVVFEALYGDNADHDRLALPTLAAAGSLPGLYEARAFAWWAHGVADGPWSPPLRAIDELDALIASTGLFAYRKARRSTLADCAPHDFLLALAATSSVRRVVLEGVGEARKGGGARVLGVYRIVVEGVYSGFRWPRGPYRVSTTLRYPEIAPFELAAGDRMPLDAIEQEPGVALAYTISWLGDYGWRDAQREGRDRGEIGAPTPTAVLSVAIERGEANGLRDFNFPTWAELRGDAGAARRAAIMRVLGVDERLFGVLLNASRDVSSALREYMARRGCDECGPLANELIEAMVLNFQNPAISLLEWTPCIKLVGSERKLVSSLWGAIRAEGYTHPYISDDVSKISLDYVQSELVRYAGLSVLYRRAMGFRWRDAARHY